MMKLGGRCIVQISQPSLNLGVTSLNKMCAFADCPALIERHSCCGMKLFFAANKFAISFNETIHIIDCVKCKQADMALSSNHLFHFTKRHRVCLLYTSPSPRD